METKRIEQRGNEGRFCLVSFFLHSPGVLIGKKPPEDPLRFPFPRYKHKKRETERRKPKETKMETKAKFPFYAGGKCGTERKRNSKRFLVDVTLPLHRLLARTAGPSL